MVRERGSKTSLGSMWGVNILDIESNATAPSPVVLLFLMLLSDVSSAVRHQHLPGAASLMSVLDPELILHADKIT